MTVVTHQTVPRTEKLNRSVAVTAEVLSWARQNQLPTGYSRVPLRTYEAYLKAHPQLSDGDGIVQTHRFPVHMPPPQPSAIAQMYRSSQRRAANLAQTSLGRAIDAWQGSVRIEAGMAPAPAPAPAPKPVRKRKDSSSNKSHGRVYPVGIREWARAQGFKVGNGSISAQVVEAFYAAHPEVERVRPAA